MDFSQNEVKQMCRHLGHTVAIHESYYQKLDQTIEKVKVARLLGAMDDGTIEKYKGKKIEDIEIEGE